MQATGIALVALGAGFTAWAMAAVLVGAGLPNGPVQSPDRPMPLPEVLDVLRRMPTRTGSWLSAESGTGGIVQMRWQDGRLWLGTPHPENATSTGKHASLSDVEWTLTVLATDDGRSASSRAEDRVAIADLDGCHDQAVVRPRSGRGEATVGPW